MADEPQTSIDYRVLLKKYMAGVIEAESVTFIGMAVDVSDVEREALLKIAQELCNAHLPPR